MGVALAMLGQRVVAVDADIGLRNLDVVMGLENSLSPADNKKLVDHAPADTAEMIKMAESANWRTTSALVKLFFRPNLNLPLMISTGRKEAMTSEG